VEAVLQEALGTGDREIADRALLLLALLSFFEGRVARAFEILDELLERAQAMSRRDRQEIANQIATSAYFGALPVEDVLQALERSGDLRGDSFSGEAHDLRVRAGLLGMAGRFDEADEAIDRSDHMYEELGVPTRRVAASQIVGEVYLLGGRLDQAEGIFREMHDTYEAMGETGFNSTICSLLGHTLCDQGRFDEAEGFAARSRELASEDDFASQSDWRLVRARVLTERGVFDEALTLADEAVAILDATDYLDWQGKGYEVRGRVLEAAGRGDDARAAYGDALDRFERKGNVVAATRIRARLEVLASEGAV
jgi:tetratricopeptide (TPR) repeat protein